MKKIVFSILIFVLLPIVSKAQLISYEPFNYTPSAVSGLSAQSSMVWKWVNTGDSIFVNSASLSYPLLLASQGNKVAFDAAGTDYYLPFTAQTSGITYVSFLVNVSSLGSLNTTGSYFANLIESNSTTNYAACVWAKQSATAGKYLIGISNRSSSTPVYYSVDMNTNQDYFITLSYEIVAGTANDVSKLWINTTSFNGILPTPDVTALGGTDVAAVGLGRFLLRQAATTTTPFILFDELRIGTTWGSVTPCNTPSIWYADVDGDGFGNALSTTLSCFQPLNYVANSTDCNDNSATINPNTIWYMDMDNDGFGGNGMTTAACVQPTGYVANNTDCNDNNAAVNAVTTWYQDLDNDGFGNLAVTISNCGPSTGYVANSTDCNDNNASVNPNAVEIYDAIDNNCNGQVDEGFTLVTYYLDNDADGFGGTTTVSAVTSPGANYVLVGGDCNDASAAIYPTAVEICDNLDNNCNGQIDENLTFLTYYQDLDNDGYGNILMNQTACSTVMGYVLDNTDCNDNNASIHPGALDIPINGIDEDCSGLDAPLLPIVLGLYEFTGVAACPVVANTVTTQPLNALFSTFTNQGASCSPTASVFSGSSWNMAPTIDLTEYNEFTLTADSCKALNLYKFYFQHRTSSTGGTPTWALRSSLDNFATNVGTGLSGNNANLMLSDTVILPASFLGLNAVTFRIYLIGIASNTATWRVDNVGVKGNVVNATPYYFYADADGDSYGNPNVSVFTCFAPLNYVSDNTDCNDAIAAINPTTIWNMDMDGDGFGGVGMTTTGCTQPLGYVINATDCDDMTAAINPSATELYDQLDNNCNGQVDEGFTLSTYYLDNDGDGFGGTTSVVWVAPPSAGYILIGGDCDDNNNAIFPTAVEICDNIDNNCNGQVDENLTFLTYYQDLDSDGYGNVLMHQTACSTVIGYVLDSTDCNDNNAAIHPGALDIPINGIDEDCSGLDAPLVPIQLGMYEFSGVAACPVTSVNITTPTANNTFSAFSQLGTTCSAASNVFSSYSWNVTPTIDLNQYYEFSVQADSCMALYLSKLAFNHRASAAGGTPTWMVRSSLDNFTSNIATGTSSNNGNVVLADTVVLGTAFTLINQVTFRFYLTGMANSSATWRVDNVSTFGNVVTVNPQIFYADLDHDSYGDTNNTISACFLPVSYVTNAQDCNDLDANINPNTVWYMDMDGDTYGDTNSVFVGCTPPANYVLNAQDCNDMNPLANIPVIYFTDADHDGFGNQNQGVFFCENPGLGYSLNQNDCNDTDSTVYPGATEICDGIDNDCANGIDDGLLFIPYFIDADHDNFGSTVTNTFCADPGIGYTLVGGDCDDANPNAYPGAVEIIDNGIDENCDNVDNYASLDELNTLNLSVYPNPNNGIFNIQSNKICERQLLNITDLNGKSVAQSVLTGTEISLNLSSLAKGYYLLTSANMKPIRIIIQ